MGFYCRLIFITLYNSLVLTVFHAEVPLALSLISPYDTSLFLTADPGRSGEKDNVILTRLMVNQMQYSAVWHLPTVSCSKLLYWCFSELTIHQARTLRGMGPCPPPWISDWEEGGKPRKKWNLKWHYWDIRQRNKAIAGSPPVTLNRGSSSGSCAAQNRRIFAEDIGRKNPNNPFHVVIVGKYNICTKVIQCKCTYFIVHFTLFRILVRSRY